VNDPITVVLVEDQYLVRDAMTRLLNLEAGIAVVGGAEDGPGGVLEVERLRPRVALVDIELPQMDGITATALMRAKSPTTVVAILTTFGRPGYLERALKAGARGFLLKEQPVASLAGQIRRLAEGEAVIDPDLAAAVLVAGPNPLSDREQDILRRARDGAGVVEIAQALYLSQGTVRNYLSLAMQKLGTSNRALAIHEAERRGWI
jgi:two-component system response regulator DesR